MRKLFKALLPNPKAAAQQRNVAAIRALAERIGEVTRPPQADIGTVSDAVDALLDRSVGAEEYIIRAAAEGTRPDPLIDLSLIDFEGLAAKFAGRKRTETDRLAQLLRQQAIASATRNPTRYELVERIEQLIDDYNAGSVNIDEYLRRLIELSQTLTEEEGRSVREGMTEEELDSTIRPVLDQELPETPYTLDIFSSKVRLVFDHVLTAYGDDGESAYTTTRADIYWPAPSIEYEGPLDVDRVADDVVARIHEDPVFAARVAAQLGLSRGRDPLDH